ncbi:MAG: hypothetical protein HUU15_00520 [Candidatus Brocadiae bacterium]|nr:hypothetical protein [Candidatus Brocadiia bacterium]
MWIVKNVLRGSIQIEDLKVKIPAKDYFDLDKIGRERAEQSRQLKLAMEEGYLQNVKKSDPGTNEAVLVKEETRSEIKSKIEELRAAIVKSPDKETVLKAIGDLRGVLAGSKDVEQIRADFDDLKKLVSSMDGDGGWLKKEFEKLRTSFFDKEKDEKTLMKREVLELRKAVLEERGRSQAVLTQFNEFRDTLLKEFKGLLTGLVAAGPRMSATGEGGEAVGERVRMTEVEIKARLKMLDQREKELQANFESIGRKVEGDMGAANQADLLSDLE